MTTANISKLRSTIAALIAVLVAFGPDLLEMLEVTDASPKWVKLCAKGLGLLVALATTGRAVVLLNRFLPDAQVPATIGVVALTTIKPTPKDPS